MPARKLVALMAAVLGILVLDLASPALGQTNTTFSTPPPAASASQPPASGASDEQALADIRAAAARTADDRVLAALAAKATAIEARARLQAAQADRQTAAVGAALKSSRVRRGSIAARRALNVRQAAARSQAATSGALAGEAGDVFNAIAQARRNEFGTRALRRFASPLAPEFWSTLADSAGGDVDRLAAVAGGAERTALAAPEPKGVISLALGFFVALAVLIPGRRFLTGRVRDQAGVSTFGLSAERLWIAVVGFALPSLAAMAARSGAAWGGLLSPQADALAGAGVVAVAWAAAILALGRALATGPTVEHRLIAISDTEAARVRVWLWAAAAVTGFGFLATRLIYLVGASVAADVAAHSLLSLAYAAVAAAILFGLRAGREEGDDHAAGRGLISLILAVASLATLIAIASGYATLAAVISGQVFWLSLLAAVTYLLLRFVDDSIGTHFGEAGRARRALMSLFRLSPSVVGQIGVLAAAGLQLLIIVGALNLALTPYGQSGDLLLAHLDRLGQPVQIGSVRISLTAVATGVGCLAIGVTLARFLRNWVVRRYLPVTSWDAGVRNSVSTGVGYLGVGVALVAALGAMGLGFQQIALVASALSVGIGFGLQQVVQNFVAGLILLIERPVKVDDWVNVDGCEGEIRRIRVRATEIRTLDRTTVIIPNSDFITKVVQNRSTGSPRGRLQLQFAIADPADLRRACELIERTAASQEQVLKTPAPAVFIDSLSAEGAVNLTCRLYAAEPRNGDAVRSRLFQAVLDACAEAKLAVRGQTAAT